MIHFFLLLCIEVGFFYEMMALTRPVLFKVMSANSEVGRLPFSIEIVRYWNSPFISSSWMSPVHKLSKSGGQCYKWRPSRKSSMPAQQGIHLLPTWMESEKGFNGVDIWIKALKMDVLSSHRDQGKSERSFQVEDVARTKVQGENIASKISQTQNSKDLH